MTNLKNAYISPPQHLLTTIYKQTWHPIIPTQSSSSAKFHRDKEPNGIGRTLQGVENRFQLKTNHAYLTKPSIQTRCQSPPSRIIRKSATSDSINLLSRNDASSNTQSLLYISARKSPKPCYQTNGTDSKKLYSPFIIWKQPPKKTVTVYTPSSEDKSNGYTTSRSSGQSTNFGNTAENKLYRFNSFSNATIPSSINARKRSLPAQVPLEKTKEESVYPAHSFRDSILPYDKNFTVTSKPNLSIASFSTLEKYHFNSYKHKHSSRQNKEEEIVLLPSSSDNKIFKTELVLPDMSSSEESTPNNSEFKLGNTDTTNNCCEQKESRSCVNDSNASLHSIKLNGSNKNQNLQIRSTLLKDAEALESNYFNDEDDKVSSCLDGDILRIKHLTSADRGNKLQEEDNNHGDKLLCHDTKKGLKTGTDRDYHIRKQEDKEEYEFAPILPKQFEKYDLAELSRLPYDVDWRNVVNLSELSFNSERQKDSQCHQHSVPSYKEHRSKIMQERKEVEAIIDRMLKLEELQASTKQREQAIKYHKTHNRSFVAKQKSASIKSFLQPASPNKRESCDLINTKVTNPHQTSQSRLSLVSSYSSSVEIYETDKNSNFVHKVARKDDDIIAEERVFDAKIKPKSCSPTETSKQLESIKTCDQISPLKQLRRPKTRSGSSGCYEYTWSERKSDKSQMKSCYSHRTRTWSTYREKGRKWNQRKGDLTTTQSQHAFSSSRATASTSSLLSNRQSPFETHNHPLATNLSRSFTRGRAPSLPNSQNICAENLPVQIQALKFTEQDYQTMEEVSEVNSSLSLDEPALNVLPQCLSVTV